MAEYTMFDENQNCIRMELNEEPMIVQRGYVIGRYGETFVADTDKEAIAKMEQWAEINTPYRGFTQIAKHLGFYDLYIDNQGRRFLHGFYDGKGKFKFAHPGIK